MAELISPDDDTPPDLPTGAKEGAIQESLQEFSEEKRQAQMTNEQIELAIERLSHSENILKDALALHQQVLRNHEERLKNQNDRMAKFEESNVILVQMLQRYDERMDAYDQDLARNERRLDVVIDDQISTREQARERGRIIDEKLQRIRAAKVRDNDF